MEGGHQEPDECFFQRVFSDHRLEVDDHLGGVPQRNAGLGQGTARHEMELYEAVCLELDERFVVQVAERRAAPQLQCLTDEFVAAGGIRRQCRPGIVEEAFESAGVDIVAVELERVPGRRRDDQRAFPAAVGLETAAQPREIW